MNVSTTHRRKRPAHMTPYELSCIPILSTETLERHGDVMVIFNEPHDLMGATIQGSFYTFGQFTDGTWYRRLA